MGKNSHKKRVVHAVQMNNSAYLGCPSGKSLAEVRDHKIVPKSNTGNIL